MCIGARGPQASALQMQSKRCVRAALLRDVRACGCCGAVWSVRYIACITNADCALLNLGVTGLSKYVLLLEIPSKTGALLASCAGCEAGCMVHIVTPDAIHTSSLLQQSGHILSRCVSAHHRALRNTSCGCGIFVFFIG